MICKINATSETTIITGLTVMIVWLILIFVRTIFKNGLIDLLLFWTFLFDNDLMSETKLILFISLVDYHKFLSMIFIFYSIFLFISQINLPLIVSSIILIIFRIWQSFFKCRAWLVHCRFRSRKVVTKTQKKKNSKNKKNYM